MKEVEKELRGIIRHCFQSEQGQNAARGSFEERRGALDEVCDWAVPEILKVCTPTEQEDGDTETESEGEG